MRKNILTLKRGMLCMALLSMIALFNACKDDDLSNEITRVTVKQMPKVAYVLGDNLDLSDLVLVVERGGDSESEVAFSALEANGFTAEPANGTVLTFDNQSIIIAHTESGKGVTQPIDVTNNVVAIGTSGAPQTAFVQGETLDLSAFSIEATLEDGTTEVYAFADFGNAITSVPAHGDVLDVSNNIITFTFESTGVQCVLDITIGEFMPVSGTVQSSLETSTYNIGDRLDMDGLSVEYTFANGNTMTIEAADFEAFGITALPAQDDKLSANDTEITLTHATSGTVVTVPLTINGMTITGMEMSIKPDKALYNDGDVIDLSGIVILLTIEGQGQVEVGAEDLATYGIVSTPAVGEAVNSDLAEIVISCSDYSGTISIPLGSELIYESDFSTSMNNWSSNQGGSASSTLSLSDGGMLVSGVVLDAGTSWAPQIIYPGIQLESGVKYQLTVHAKAVEGEGNFKLNFNVGDGDGSIGWGPISPGWGVQIPDSGEVTFSESFVSGVNHSAARILFDGSQQTNSFIITYVKFEKLL